MSSTLQQKVATQPVLFAKVWQHPYVDVMRQLGVLEGKHAKVAGDVRVLLDPTLNKQVVCIKGAVSAANYLELPGPGTTSKERARNPAAARTTALGLTGDYLYLQLRAMADRYFVIHVDVATVQGLVIRLSISNIFKYIKLQNHGRVLQLPCDFLSTKWSVLALHLPSLLEECSNNVQSMHASGEGEEGISPAAFAGSASARSHTGSTSGGASSSLKYVYSSIQRIQFCSSLFVRNVVTSSHRYSIGSFPKDVRFFLPRGASFDDCYEWFWIVTPPPTGGAAAAPTKDAAQRAHLRAEDAQQQEDEEQLAAMEQADAEQRAAEQEVLRAAGASQPIDPSDLRSSVGAGSTSGGVADSQQRLWDPHGRAPRTPLKSSVPVQVFSGVDVTQSPNRGGSVLQQQEQGGQARFASRRGSNASVSGAAQQQQTASTSAPTTASNANNRPLTAAEFDEPQPQQLSARATAQQHQAAAPPAALLGGVGALADASVPTHSPVQARQAQAITAADRSEYEEERKELNESVSSGARIVRHVPSGKDAAASSSASAAPSAAASSDVLSPDPVLALDKIIGYSASRTTSNLCWSPCGQFMLYPSNNVLVISNVRTGAQEFLTGHTEAIAVVTVASNGLIATGQSGRSPLIRLWNFATRQCVGILMAHSSDLRCLCFSFLNLMLGAVGRDAQGRVLIVIWDVSAVLDSGAIHVVAKQLSDYGINRLLFSPFRDDPLHLISCGHESIRFWRIKTKHLPGSSLQLNEHARNTFTALAFEAKYGEADHTSKRMYVATASGSLFQINYATRQLECIYKLHSGPIYSLDVNEGFAVTGSGDNFLRVWPLDFSDFFLQCQHKAAVTAVGMSSDGLHVLVGSENGCIGVLDLSSTAYQTRLRAHLDTIYAVAFDPHRDEFATVSKDGTIRIFGVHSLEQIYEFYSPHESVLCVAYHPLSSEYRLACGFASGSMRIMDIATTSMHVDYAQHTGRVLDVVFSADGLFLYSNGEDGNICAYDVSKNYLPTRMFTTYRNQPVPLPPSVLRSLHAEAEKAAAQSASARRYKADHDARTPFLSHHLDRARQEAHELDNPSAAHNPLLASHSASHARHCFTGSESGLPSGAAASAVPHSHGPRQQPGPQPLPAHALAISADGTLLATIGADPTSIVLLATETLRQVRLLSTQSLPVAKLLFAPLTSPQQAPELVAVLTDSSFQRFLLADGSLLAHVSATPSMKHKQERALAAPSREIGFAFAAAGQVSLPKPGATCTSAALSPLGLYLLTGSSEPLLRVWDFHSRPHAPHFQSLLAHQSALQPAEGVTGVTFSPDGRTVLTTGGDAVWLWKLLADEAGIAEAKARKQRRATDNKLVAEALLRDGEDNQGNGRIPPRMYSGDMSHSQQQQQQQAPFDDASQRQHAHQQ